MIENQASLLVGRKYRNVHGASVLPGFSKIMDVQRDNIPRAALGYRRAGDDPLFLECYLDAPVEDYVATALRRPVDRADIIEIGSLAAEDGFAMIALWAMAANDLGAECDIAVATLTAPLRRMFARMGVPLQILAPATADRVADPKAWGRYYDADPMVCAGVIADGQRAMIRHFASRARIAA